MFVFPFFWINFEAVELVGQGVRGGKRAAFSTASTPFASGDGPQIHSPLSVGAAAR
jgi:hypothetical protein